jgi:hypothetical protein
MPLENWIQHSRVNQFLYDWQTVIAGVLALAAGIITVVVTMIIANKQITASRKEADRVIAATREQTETTVRLEDRRNASEAEAFRVMLEAAMTRVLAEAAWARSVYPQCFTEERAGASPAEVLAVRRCISKGAFAELRGACIRQGSSLTGEFLDLEREIDSFALQYEDRPSSTLGLILRLGLGGKLVGLGEQLAVIEAKATELREKAARDRFGLTVVR